MSMPWPPAATRNSSPTGAVPDLLSDLTARALPRIQAGADVPPIIEPPYRLPIIDR